MNFDIDPLKGAAGLVFGMSMKEVRTHLQAPSAPFKRALETTTESDFFESLGTFAYYDVNRRLEALEISDPSTVTLGGMPLLGVPLSEALYTLAAYGVDVETDSAGADCSELGIGLYSPGWDEEPGLVVEGVIVYRAGYYETP